MRSALIWGALALAVIVPVVAAALSPLLAWREPIYIAAGFGGIVGLTVMVAQPLLAANLLPGLSRIGARHLHRWMGLVLVSAVVIHVAGLWITSPPDVIDALLFRSPTPFSAWGVIAMWAVFAAALLALLRRRLALRWTQWRFGHVGLVCLAVGCTVIHALLIEGTMETFTKLILCGVACLALIVGLRAMRRGGSRVRLSE